MDDEHCESKIFNFRKIGRGETVNVGNPKTIVTCGEYRRKAVKVRYKDEECYVMLSSLEINRDQY